MGYPIRESGYASPLALPLYDKLLLGLSALGHTVPMLRGVECSPRDFFGLRHVWGTPGPEGSVTVVTIAFPRATAPGFEGEARDMAKQ